MLNRMEAKGFLARRTFHGVILYNPLITRPQGLAKMVREFSDRVLEGEYGSVVALFPRGSALTPAEVEELARLVEGWIFGPDELSGEPLPASLKVTVQFELQ